MARPKKKATTKATRTADRPAKKPSAKTKRRVGPTGFKPLKAQRRRKAAADIGATNTMLGDFAAAVGLGTLSVEDVDDLFVRGELADDEAAVEAQRSLDPRPLRKILQRGRSPKTLAGPISHTTEGRRLSSLEQGQFANDVVAILALVSDVLLNPLGRSALFEYEVFALAKLRELVADMTEAREGHMAQPPMAVALLELRKIFEEISRAWPTDVPDRGPSVQQEEQMDAVMQEAMPKLAAFAVKHGLATPQDAWTVAHDLFRTGEDIRGEGGEEEGENQADDEDAHGNSSTKTVGGLGPSKTAAEALGTHFGVSGKTVEESLGRSGIEIGRAQSFADLTPSSPTDWTKYAGALRAVAATFGMITGSEWPEVSPRFQVRGWGRVRADLRAALGRQGRPLPSGLMKDAPAWSSPEAHAIDRIAVDWLLAMIRRLPGPRGDKK
jgi:hypothetical protein